MRRADQIWILFSGIILFMGSRALAQNNSSARSMAMANAYTAVADGVSAPIWNPANLALPDHVSFSLKLVGAGIQVGNLSFSKATYDRYNGKYLTQSDVAAILSDVPEEGFQLLADSDVQVLGFSIGRFALSFSGSVLSNLSVSKDYFRILLQGMYTNQNYNIGNNSGEAIGYSSITGSYAFPVSFFGLKRFYVGTNVNYLIGFGYAEVLESYGQLTHNGWEVNGEGFVRARYAQGGAGFALDFALASEQGGWKFGVMWKNAYSKINWTSKPEEYEAHFYTERGLNAENASNADSLDAMLITEEGSREIAPFSISLPAEIRFGMSKRWKTFLVAIDYHQGFSHRPGISKKPYLAFATEWQGIGFFPLRLGLGFGGEHGMQMATGFGFKLGFFRLDYGVSFQGALAPRKARALGMAFTTYLNF